MYLLLGPQKFRKAFVVRTDPSCLGFVLKIYQVVLVVVDKIIPGMLSNDCLPLCLYSVEPSW